MLYLLFSLIFMIPVISGIGKIFENFFGTVINGISGILLNGILAISLAWTVLVFFIPLDLYVEIATIIIGLAAFFNSKFYEEWWSFFTTQKSYFFPFFLIILFFGSFFPFILDHFGYYVPSVKWLSEIGLVRGISNLDLLLGQMSVWHIFQAGFSHFSDPFLRINVLVLTVYLIYTLEKRSWIHLLFFPIFFLFLQSPSPDLPVITFSLMILNEILQKNTDSKLLFAFSVFIFAIKPTMIWLPVLVLLYSAVILHSTIKNLLPGLLIFLLFIFKNIWTFGFPFFPVQLLDFGFSWSTNTEILKNSAQTALLKTFDLQYSSEQIQSFSVLDYFRNWLFLAGIKGKIHLLFVVSMISFFIFSLRKNSKPVWLIFISVFIKCIVVLVFSAQYRFFLDVFFVIFFVLFSNSISKSFVLVAFSVLSVTVGIFLSFPNLLKNSWPSFRLSDFVTGFKSDQLITPSVFELKKYKTYRIGNLDFKVVQKYPLSFDTPLPAISPQFLQDDLDAGIFPQMKGKSLKKGFIWRNLKEREKNALREIISSLPAENHK